LGHTCGLLLFSSLRAAKKVMDLYLSRYAITRVADYFIRKILAKPQLRSGPGGSNSLDLHLRRNTLIDLEGPHVEVHTEIFCFSIFESIGDMLDGRVIGDPKARCHCYH
jgi:hypothetical protein